MGKMNIKEIARLAGVSQTAVSFALNGKPGISKETRERILEIVRQTNYQSDRNSKRLVMQRSFNLCLAYLSTSSPFDDLFYFEAAKGMIDEANASGYNIVLSKIELQDGQFILPQIITAHDADGVVVFQDLPISLLRTIEQDYRVPCVVLDSYAPADDILRIHSNAILAAGMAVRYLTDRGHRKIAMIGSSFLPDFWKESYKGFAAALAERGEQVHPAWVQNKACDEESAYQCMENILQAPDRPSALFCVSDRYAISAIRCLKAHGLRVPEDMSVIGLDDIILSRYCEPALTTVAYDKESMGRKALLTLISRINGESATSSIVNPTGVVERQSVGDYIPAKFK